MKLSNKAYNILKWVLLIFIDALITLIGPYISAESGEAGDTIKMYSPSI